MSKKEIEQFLENWIFNSFAWTIFSDQQKENFTSLLFDAEPKTEKEAFDLFELFYLKYVQLWNI